MNDELEGEKVESPYSVHRTAFSIARAVDEQFTRMKEDISRGVELSRERIERLHLNITHTIMLCDDFDEKEKNGVKMTVASIRRLVKDIADEMSRIEMA